jgi:hypothetical protein
MKKHTGIFDGRGNEITVEQAAEILSQAMQQEIEDLKILSLTFRRFNEYLVQGNANRDRREKKSEFGRILLGLSRASRKKESDALGSGRPDKQRFKPIR